MGLSSKPDDSLSLDDISSEISESEDQFFPPSLELALNGECEMCKCSNLKEEACKKSEKCNWDEDGDECLDRSPKKADRPCSAASDDFECEKREDECTWYEKGGECEPKAVGDLRHKLELYERKGEKRKRQLKKSEEDLKVVKADLKSAEGSE